MPTKMRISAIKVNQWLTEWDGYRFRPEDRQKTPEGYFYVSSIPLAILRRLSNMPRRGEATETGQQQATGPRYEDIGIQRGFEEQRADDIKDFIKAGYPWATLPKREQDRFTGLRACLRSLQDKRCTGENHHLQAGIELSFAVLP